MYTDVKRYSGFKDTHNYIVTAPSIDGPWSDPIHINSSGFDPSLFHDTDGRKYFMNMYWNQRAEGPGGHHDTARFVGRHGGRHTPAVTGRGRRRVRLLLS